MSFKFYKHRDSMGYDIMHIPNKTIEELAKICQEYERCIGFNSLGYMKFHIEDPSKFVSVNSFRSESDGLYVHVERYNRIIENDRHKIYTGIEGYQFYPNKDSMFGDITHIPAKSLAELKKAADADPQCIGFNTYGYLKHQINSVSDFVNLYATGSGLYVKNNRVDTKFRVKMTCNWCDGKTLVADWSRMAKSFGKWNNIEFTHEDTNIDFYCILNKPWRDEFYVSERSIIFYFEPWCYDPNQNWGVKTWGMWANPDPDQWLQVRPHTKYYNAAFWQLQLSWSDLQTKTFEKTKLLSTICSSKYFDPGHIYRIDFIKYIEEQNDPVVSIDVWNEDNAHNLKSYTGRHPPGNKDVGIVPYKYYFMMENNGEHNFVTEKMWEPLLTDTLVFYWGCPNMGDLINPKAYIELDPTDFAKSFKIVKDAILNDEWSKRIEYIRQEKQKVLNYYNFFPTVERIITTDFGFTKKPTDRDILWHKYFKKEYDNVAFISSNCRHSIIDKLIECGIDHIYLINYGDKLVSDNNQLTIINQIDKSKYIEFIKAYAENSNSIIYNFSVDSNAFYIMKYIDELINYKCIKTRDNTAFVSTSEIIKDSTNLVFDNASETLIVDENTVIEENKLSDNVGLYVINLERRPDRREYMNQLGEYHSLDLNFFKAIDGKVLTATDEIKRMFANNDFASRRGFIGCALSHYNIWKQLLNDEKCNKYVIFEDDIEFDIGFKKKLSIVLSKMEEDTDVLHLGYTYYRHKRELYEKKVEEDSSLRIVEFDKSLYIGGLFGYVVTKSGAKKMTEFMETNGIRHGIDYAMFLAYADKMNLKQYELLPHIVHTEYVDNENRVDSDIQYNVDSLF